MRVLVCGGRYYDDGPYAFSILDIFGATTVIEGGARGADSLARAWAIRRGIPCETYRADWDANPRSAGVIRNSQMLREGKPGLVIAFPGGRGTADMIRQSHKAGVAVLVL